MLPMATSMSELVVALAAELTGGVEVTSPVEDAERIVRTAAAHGRDEAWMRDVAGQRRAGAPLGRLLGTQRFMSVELHTAPGALVPRAETELLGWAAVERLRARAADGRGQRMADVCCGSGNLACGVAHELAGLEVYATDLTEPCVALARRNVEALGLAERVHVSRGDLLASLREEGLAGALDVLVCNPPYISSSRLGKERAVLLAHEPVEAFDGGPYGLNVHQRLIREAPDLVRAGGLLLMEIGLGQERQIELLFRRAKEWGAPELLRNAHGEPRAVVAQRSAV